MSKAVGLRFKEVGKIFSLQLCQLFFNAGVAAKEIGAGEKLLTQCFKALFLYNKREVGTLLITGVDAVRFLTAKIQKAVFADGVGIAVVLIDKAAVSHHGKLIKILVLMHRCRNG